MNAMSAPCSCRVHRELDRVLRGRGRGARLDHDVRVDRRCFLDRELEELLAFVERQRPPLGDAAGEPQHRVAEVTDAVADEGPVRVPVDVVAVAPANGV